MNVSQNVLLSLSESDFCLIFRHCQIGGRQTGVVCGRVEDEAGQLLFLTSEPQDEAEAGPWLFCPGLASVFQTEAVSAQLSGGGSQ